ncbi:MAG: type II toxin-antitoxin system RelE/ParE family toxin [Selenomonadaceae bacterium]|nr:type II toxin-antitoxin system RelE/ParE family toxin [Selenomonadaceae bacterium]
MEGCSDPRQHGKALTANLSGLWRYRIEDYRVIVKIVDDELIIVAVSIDHRKQIYK